MSRAEAVIQRDIKKELVTRYNALVFKINADAQRGIPDLLSILPGGLTLFIEVKTNTGKLSALQARTIRQITEKGAHAIVARSVSDVTKEIMRLRNE